MKLKINRKKKINQPIGSKAPESISEIISSYVNRKYTWEEGPCGQACKDLPYKGRDNSCMVDLALRFDDAMGKEDYILAGVILENIDNEAKNLLVSYDPKDINPNNAFFIIVAGSGILYSAILWALMIPVSIFKEGRPEFISFVIAALTFIFSFVFVIGISINLIETNFTKRHSLTATFSESKDEMAGLIYTVILLFALASTFMWAGPLGGLHI